MNGRTIRTSTTRAKFLKLLGETGNITATCNALGLHRPIYAWRHADAEFAAAWDSALKLDGEALEDEARRRAMAGSDALMVFMLRALKPEKYRERSTVDVNSRTITDYRLMSTEDLRARLAVLRTEQDNLPIIEADNIIELDAERGSGPG
jgi:hypothetical protein